MLSPGSPILFGAGFDPETVQLRNFDRPEASFAWSMGRWAEVEFAWSPPRPAGGRGARAVPPAALLDMAVDLDVFRAPPVLAGQNVLTYLNGMRVHSAYVTEPSQLSFRIRPDLLMPVGNRLTFDLPDAVRPLEFGMSDNRMLGVKLFALSAEPAATG